MAARLRALLVLFLLAACETTPTEPAQQSEVVFQMTDAGPSLAPAETVTLTLEGPTTQTITAGPGTTVRVKLKFGSYRATLVGLAGGLVVWRVETSFSVSGAETRVTLPALTPYYTLTVRGAGAGNGNVVSNPAGITCAVANGSASGTCAAAFATGTSVTLTGTPGTNFRLGWSGDCSGTGACQVSLSQARTVTASFTAAAAAPVATTTAADEITSTSGRMNGTVAQDGAAYTVWFEWGTSATLATFGTSGSATGPTASCPGTITCNWFAPLTGLSGSTRYYFRLVAQNATGTSRGAIQSFLTLAPVAPAPPVITGLTTTLVGINHQSCSVAIGGNGGTLYSYQFSYTDVNGDVTLAGSPISVTWTTAGGIGNQTYPATSPTGTGSAGTIRLDLCHVFGTYPSITGTFTLRDAANTVSNALSSTVNKPTGAAAPGIDGPETFVLPALPAR